MRLFFILLPAPIGHSCWNGSPSRMWSNTRHVWVGHFLIFWISGNCLDFDDSKHAGRILGRFLRMPEFLARAYQNSLKRFFPELKNLALPMTRLDLSSFS